MLGERRGPQEAAGDLGAEADLGARADDDVVADVGACGDDRALADQDRARDPGAGLDAGAGLDDDRAGDVRAVLDGAAPGQVVPVGVGEVVGQGGLDVEDGGTAAQQAGDVRAELVVAEVVGGGELVRDGLGSRGRG
ncbi:hypothetical protein [Streptomyces sp. NPDC086023]|uniref:hypothetical protein n=1 Tax=Streptomyces sp. NPDC086023 TaxID=3365746 RepID=UPI0037D58770